MIVLGLGGLAIAILIFLVAGPVGALITTLLAALAFPLRDIGLPQLAGAR
jgi:hypothetical protein